jgi:hypothetical protein
MIQRPEQSNVLCDLARPLGEVLMQTAGVLDIGLHKSHQEKMVTSTHRDHIGEFSHHSLHQTQIIAYSQ